MHQDDRAVTTHVVDTGGLRVHYRRCGTPGAPPVVLLHGFPQDSTMWRHQMAALGERFEVFAPDTRGYGGTDKPRVRVTRDLLGRDVVDFVRALGLGPVALVGHDWGGIIAFKAAIDHPDVFVRLGLIDTLTTVWSWRGVHGWWFKCEPEADDFWPRHGVEFIRAVFAGERGTYGPHPHSPWAQSDDRAAGARLWDPTRTWTPADVEHYVRVFDDPGAWFHAVEYYRHALPFHRLHEDGAFEFLSNPKVARRWRDHEFEDLVFGPEDWHKTYPHEALWLFSPFLVPRSFVDGALPPDDHVPSGDLYADSFARHLPRLRCRGALCGHFVPEEAPERTNEVLLEFLADWNG